MVHVRLRCVSVYKPFPRKNEGIWRLIVTCNPSTSPTTSTTNKSGKSASVVSLTSDSDSLFAKRFPPPPKKLPSSKRIKAKKKGPECREAFVFVEEEVKKANQRRRRRNKKSMMKGRRSRTSAEDESVALQSLEDISLDQGADQVDVREDIC